MAKVSICIPYHDSPNMAFFLSRLLQSIGCQSFKDYEIILTKEGPMPVNTNAALKKASGELVKIMYSDDYFSGPHSLQTIVESFDEHDSWLVSGCTHYENERIVNNHFAQYTDKIKEGINTIGSPSVLTMRRDKMLLFDENLSFMLDCDLYVRLYEKYGPPKILDSINVVIGLHPEQMSNKMSLEEKQNELNYLLHKYKVI